MSDSEGVDIEDLLTAAQIAGAGDPEQEIEGLQDLLRAAWGLMSERQQADLLESDEAQALLEDEDDEEEEADGE